MSSATPIGTSAAIGADAPQQLAFAVFVASRHHRAVQVEQYARRSRRRRRRRCGRRCARTRRPRPGRSARPPRRSGSTISAPAASASSMNAAIAEPVPRIGGARRVAFRRRAAADGEARQRRRHRRVGVRLVLHLGDDDAHATSSWCSVNDRRTGAARSAEARADAGGSVSFAHDLDDRRRPPALLGSRRATTIPWLSDEPPIPFRYGDYRPIRRRYLPPDYRADAAPYPRRRQRVCRGRMGPRATRSARCATSRASRREHGLPTSPSRKRGSIADDAAQRARAAGRVRFRAQRSAQAARQSHRRPTAPPAA